MTRRRFVTCLTAGVLLPAAPRAGRAALASFAADLARIEVGIGGRLGCALIDTRNGARAGRRMDERFPLCSTFKVLAISDLLARVDAGHERLDRRVTYATTDLVPYSPVTQLHVGDGMTLSELCAAAMTRSDNTAANLLLAAIGGPPAVTAFARAIGDGVTRLDRTEIALNEARPGDLRDTTTPAAMAADLQHLALGPTLSAASRAKLVDWMDANTTGGMRLRAGLPSGWRIGDKTGTGEFGTANDVALVRSPGRAPLVLTVYLTGGMATAQDRNAAIAAVARAAVTALG